jgi:hypothetical protein
MHCCRTIYILETSDVELSDSFPTEPCPLHPVTASSSLPSVAHIAHPAQSSEQSYCGRTII